MLNIMIIETEAHCREELVDMLNEYEQVDITGEFTNASDALRSLIEKPPDLVFAGIKLPGINGLELVGTIHIAFPDIKVVLMSEDGGLALEGYDVGAWDYILKPLKKERVAKIIQKIK